MFPFPFLLFTKNKGCSSRSFFRCLCLCKQGRGILLFSSLLFSSLLFSSLLFSSHLLFSSQKDVILLNVGGIANVTLLRARGGDVCGFDTGPGNMVCVGFVLFCFVLFCFCFVFVSSHSLLFPPLLFPSFLHS